MSSPAPASSRAGSSTPVNTAHKDVPQMDFAWAVGTFFGAFKEQALVAMAGFPGGPRGYVVLDAIDRGQFHSQLALARRLGVDKTAMTYLLDELESAKLVRRRPAPSDRRARVVAITAAGIRALGRSRQQIDSTERQLLSALTPSEALAFRLMLERIALAVQPDPAGAPEAPACGLNSGDSRPAPAKPV